MPNQTEIATNKAVLDSVDTKMATLDAAIARLDDLVARRTTLTDSVADLRRLCDACALVFGNGASSNPRYRHHISCL